ncbi:MAG: hypothetical protein IKU11_11610 [Clostridia bacterium]|nr:hypothetical protein [Clostridia bacterium]
MLTLELAKELLSTTTTEEHLFLHAKNVMAAMGGLAVHFGENKEHWMAIGYLHDYDYEQHPEEHLKYTEEPLKAAGLSDEEVRAILAHGYGVVNEVEPLTAAGLTQEEIRAILAHGYGHVNDVEPVTNLEKSLYTVDELTGIVQAAARMRPLGITDMEISSFMKKFKDKKFAAKCDRELIKNGCALLGMEVKAVAEIVIEAMKAHAEELGLGPKE